jgi:chemotaxis signal transduction protein
VASLAADQKALVFSAGGARLALRVSHVREILSVEPSGAEVVSRGDPVPSVVVAELLGLGRGRPAPFALLAEGGPRRALRVEALHGIVDLSDAEFFQLPARTRLPTPAPFSGAIVARGEVALEVALGALGPEPLRPAAELAPPGADVAPAAERELRFARGGRVYAVPLSLLVQVLERPTVAPVPLAPASHRGLLYHGRALHPVVDVAVLYGEPGPALLPTVLLVDAGGAVVGVAADRVLGVGEAAADAVRPPWDSVFGA